MADFLTLNKAHHYGDKVVVLEFNDHSRAVMTVDQYDAFLDFAVDKVSETLTKIKELINDR